MFEVVTTAPREAGGESQSGQTVLNASGYVTPRRAATVSAKMTGKVIDVLVEEGKRVEQGQVLAHLDASNIQASRALSEAQVRSARVAVEETRALVVQARANWQRTTQLVGEKVATAADLDKAEADYRSLEARVQRQEAEVVVAERSLATWDQQLEDTVIRAPFGGIVTAKNAQPGEVISPMSAGGFTRTGICTLVDMGSLEIEVDVNESYLNRVAPGRRVEATLDAYPDWKIAGHVIAIIPTADRQKATVKVRVGFEKLDPRILPDMGVKVAFLGAEEGGAVPVKAGGRALLLPRTAVRDAEGRTVVWLLKNGRLERRAVQAEPASAEDTRVGAGVSAGDRVVLDPPPGLIDGAPAREKGSR